MTNELTCILGVLPFNLDVLPNQLPTVAWQEGSPLLVH